MTKYTLAVLGSGGVGKSALSVQFVQGVFLEKYDPTVEENYLKIVQINKERVELEILDTAGSEVLTAMRDLYMKKAEGCLLVYSITMKSTFVDVQEIIEQLFRVKDTERVPIILVGNKCDMERERTVSRDEGQKLANSLPNALFMETSARDNVNVEACFIALAKQVMNENGPRTDGTPKKQNCVIS